MASRILAKASSRVFPCDQQLLRDGQCATTYPSSPRSTTIFRFIIRIESHKRRTQGKPDHEKRMREL